MSTRVRRPVLPSTVAIIGTGWLGSEVASKLAKFGTHVIAASRSGTWKGEGRRPARVEMVQYDLVQDRDDGLKKILARADAAVFCYAPGQSQDRRCLYVEGAAVIARVCCEVSLDRVVYTSSTSALATADGWVDEEATDWPDGQRGRIQRDAEDCIRTALDRIATPWTILRLAGLYGPGRELERIYRLTDADRIRPGDGLERTNLVHLDDAATAVIAALGLPKSESGIVHICDDDHRTRREVVAGVARAGALPDPIWEKCGSEGSPRGKMVSNERMKTLLGIQLEHPTHGV